MLASTVNYPRKKRAEARFVREIQASTIDPTAIPGSSIPLDRRSSVVANSLQPYYYLRTKVTSLLLRIIDSYYSTWLSSISNESSISRK